MEAKAYIKYLRASPKKMRSLGKTVVGLLPGEAIERLSMVESKTARMLAQVIKSALANATNNLRLDPLSLRVKTLQVLKAPFLKRWQPVSRGRAHQIKKEMVHVRVVLGEINKKELKLKNKEQRKKKKDI